MAPSVAEALAITPASSASERTIDITTTGSLSGRPRRIEVWFYRLDGEIYLSTQPARRKWYGNIKKTPRFTFHLKHGVSADLAAEGRPVTDPADRERVFRSIIDDLNQPANPAGIPQPVEPLDQWMAESPLIHVTFPSDNRQEAQNRQGAHS